jgi:hypothetical protein
MKDKENLAISGDACLSSDVKSPLALKSGDGQQMQVDESFSSSPSSSSDSSASSSGRPGQHTGTKQETISLDTSLDTSLEDTKESPKRKPINDPAGFQRKKKSFVPSSSSSSSDERAPVGGRKKQPIVLLSSDDDSDDGLRKALANFLSTTTTIGTPDEDSDSSIETPVPARLSRKTKKGAPTASKAMKRLESNAAPLPTPTDKEAVLQDIDIIADRNLQRLLWSMGCRYTLLSYQFLGVRSLTGVDATYPSTQPKKHYTCQDWQKVLRETKMADQNNRNKNRGLLMADVMGLVCSLLYGLHSDCTN